MGVLFTPGAQWRVFFSRDALQLDQIDQKAKVRKESTFFCHCAAPRAAPNCKCAHGTPGEMQMRRVRATGS
jgi:hypothetical protein